MAATLQFWLHFVGSTILLASYFLLSTKRDTGKTMKASFESKFRKVPYSLLRFIVLMAAVANLALSMYFGIRVMSN
jgi:hypothetical protein